MTPKSEAPIEASAMGSRGRSTGHEPATLNCCTCVHSRVTVASSGRSYETHNREAQNLRIFPQSCHHLYGYLVFVMLPDYEPLTSLLV